MPKPIKSDILEFCALIIASEQFLAANLTSADAGPFADIVGVFASALQDGDSVDHRAAWSEARMKLRQFEAYRRLEEEPGKFIEETGERKPQTTEEVVPQLIACAKRIREKPATTDGKK